MLTRKYWQVLAAMVLAVGMVAGLAAAAEEEEKPKKEYYPKFARDVIDVGVVVSDIEKAARFYKEAIGFIEVPGFEVAAEMAGDAGLTDYKEFKVRVMALGAGPEATKIKLMQIPGKKVDNKFINSSLGLSYLTIFVNDMGDAVKQAKAAGATIVKDPYKLGGEMYLTLLKDPDGNTIEFVGQGEHKYQYAVHDMGRKKPEVVQPGAKPGDPPSDAVVLFDGTDLSRWSDDQGRATKWILKDGAMESVAKAGYIRSKEEFGSMQLHIEWATPTKVNPKDTGQGRGNSGVFLMGIYEIQVLDSFNNVTYADGQASSVYGQKPPEVNVSRAPGEWQSYDIIFHRPIFNQDRKLVRPGTVTVLHNGVLTQDNWEIKGNTWHKHRSEYTYHGEKGPLRLQDHGNPVRYRNVWVRPLAD